MILPSVLQTKLTLTAQTEEVRGLSDQKMLTWASTEVNLKGEGLPGACADMELSAAPLGADSLDKRLFF